MREQLLSDTGGETQWARGVWQVGNTKRVFGVGPSRCLLVFIQPCRPTFQKVSGRLLSKESGKNFPSISQGIKEDAIAMDRAADKLPGAETDNVTAGKIFQQHWKR